MKTQKAWLAVVVAGIVAVAGCGSDPADSASTAANGKSATSGDSTVQPAANRSTQALLEAMNDAQLKKGTVVVDTEVKIAEGVITGTAVIKTDKNGTSADMTMKLPMELGGAPQEMRMIMLPAEIYFQMPGPDFPEGKWLKISEDGDDPFSQMMAPAFEQMKESTDVNAMLDMYGSAELKAVGTETINGVKTTKYATTVDLNESDSWLGDGDAAELQDMLDMGASTVDITMWVDGDDLMHKAETTFSVGDQDFTSTMTMSKWGESVDIKAPPASDVMSMEDLASLGS